jgi:hypothetical protein
MTYKIYTETSKFSKMNTGVLEKISFPVPPVAAV